MNDNFLKIYKEHLIIEAQKYKNENYDMSIWYDIAYMVKKLPDYIDKVLVHIIDISTEEGIDSTTKSFIRDTVSDIESNSEMYGTGDIEYIDDVKICFKDGTRIRVFGAESGGMISIFKDNF